jgi:hypothetical protein
VTNGQTVPEIIKSLAKYQDRLSIRIILTSSARQFLNGQSAEQPTVSLLTHMPNVEAVYDDADEWGPQPWKRGASILHIEYVFPFSFPFSIFLSSSLLLHIFFNIFFCSGWTLQKLTRKQ